MGNGRASCINVSRFPKMFFIRVYAPLVGRTVGAILSRESSTPEADRAPEKLACSRLSRVAAAATYRGTVKLVVSTGTATRLPVWIPIPPVSERCACGTLRSAVYDSSSRGGGGGGGCSGGGGSGNGGDEREPVVRGSHSRNMGAHRNTIISREYS